MTAAIMQKAAAGDELKVERSVVHIQVRRVLEEDLRIGDGKGEGLSAWDRDLIAVLHLKLSDQVDAVLHARSFPRASPLGSSTQHWAAEQLPVELS